MLKLSLKIWAVANVMVFGIFAIALFPRGINIGLAALVYSCPLSLPAIAIIYLLLRFLSRAHGKALFSWLVLLAGTAVSAFITYLLFNCWFANFSHELNFILPLSFICAYCAVLSLFPAIDYLFKTIQYENENECY